MAESPIQSVLNPPALAAAARGPGLVQADNTDARANLVTFVDADEHAGEWFELARQAQPAGDDAAMSGDGFGEIGDDVVCIVVVTAYQYILLGKRTLMFPQIDSGHMMECTHKTGVGNQPLALFRCAAVGHVQGKRTLLIKAKRVHTADHNLARKSRRQRCHELAMAVIRYRE